MNLSELTQKFLTPIEAAEFLQLSKSQTSALCKQGFFVGAKKISGRWFIPRESIFIYKKLYKKNAKKQNSQG